MCVYILNTSGPLYAIAIIKFHCIRGSEIFAGIIILSLYTQIVCMIHCNAYTKKGCVCVCLCISIFILCLCVNDNENAKNKRWR